MTKMANFPIADRVKVRLIKRRNSFKRKLLRDSKKIHLLWLFRTAQSFCRTISRQLPLMSFRPFRITQPHFRLLDSFRPSGIDHVPTVEDAGPRREKDRSTAASQDGLIDGRLNPESKNPIHFRKIEGLRAVISITLARTLSTFSLASLALTFVASR